MRRSIVEAVRKHARDHPELFEAPDDSPDEGADPSSPAALAELPAAVPLPAAAPSPARPAVVAEPATPPSARIAPQPPSSRRSPRNPASSRSAAAAAIAALQQVPTVTAGPPREKLPASARREPSRALPRAAAPDIRLFDAGAAPDSDGSGSSSEDSDSDWSPLDDPLATSLPRGGRMRRADEEDELARAGVRRSFAKGFIANAQFAAGGRSMYQLYKEVTASFSESSRR